MRSRIDFRPRRLLLIAAAAVVGTAGVALAEGEATQPDGLAASEVADGTGTAGESSSEPTDGAVVQKPRRAAAQGVEEITVTARKREERLQDTPIAITAFDTTSLRDKEIRTISDVERFSPNLQFDNSIGAANSARIYLRGVGNGDSSIRDDPGVGLYVDGVYLPRAQGALITVSDLARVEVLRGPQGTLFGKNTIGGAINIVTQKPGYEFGGVAEIRAGTEGLFETRGAVDLPLVPEVAAMRVSFTTATRDGYMRNRATGSRTNDNKVLGGRVQFLLNPTERLEFQLSVDHSRENRASNAAKCKVVRNADGLLQGALFRALAPEIQTGCEADDARSNDEFTEDGPQKSRLRTYGAALTATYDVSDTLTFKSVSSWRRQKIGTAGDVDGTVFNILQDQREFGLDKTTQDAFSQEFNLSGLAMDGRLKWTTGLYGFMERNQANDSTRTLAFTDDDIPFSAEDLARNPRLVFIPGVGRTLTTFSDDGALTFNGLGDCVGTTRIPVAGGRSLCFRAFGSVPNVGFLKADNKSYAAYGEFTYDLTDKLSFTGGLRFTHERKRVAEQEVALLAPRGPFNEGRVNEPAAGSVPGGIQFLSNYDVAKRFSKFTPRATLQYRFTEDINAYATFSKGFKSGGFAADADGLPPNDYDPEVLTSYEAGFKSSFFDRRVIANVAGFINYYQDIQLTSVGARADGTQVVTTLNAGEARILGTELELTVAPVPGLILSSTVGVTKARYTKFDAGNSNAGLPGTPALTLTQTVAYTLPLGDLGDLRSTFTWNHQGKKASDVSDPDITRINKRGTLSGRISLELADGQTEISLFGTNLLNREYFTNAIDQLAGIGITSRNYAPPRRYGIELRRRF